MDNFLGNNWCQLLPRRASRAAEPLAKKQLKPYLAIADDGRDVTLDPGLSGQRVIRTGPHRATAGTQCAVEALQRRPGRRG